MPPKTVRKSVGPGRRGGRIRGTPKVAAQPDPEVVAVPEESAKPVKQEDPVEVKEEDVQVEVKKDEDMKIKEVNEEKVEKVEEKPVADNGIDRSKREDNVVKDSVEEYEKGERLDLEDNDPEESEPEEFVGDGYDEKEVTEDDVQEEVEVEDVGTEEEDGGDVHEGEMEDPTEELEPEDEEHEHVDDEHADLAVDADEQEHHDVFKERRKRKEFEVFVGGLDKDATEDDLRKVFSAVGDVSEIRLMMNAQTKKNKGFAFLRFATVDQAKRACLELKNPVVNGKHCGVTPSQDSDTLFLGNICKTWTKEALKEKLKTYGIDTVEELTLVEDNKNDGTNRGFAFLEFSSRSDAMDAFKRLQKRGVTFGVDRPAKVSFADSFVDPGDEIMAQVKTVFVDGLPVSWDEARVRELLKKYGKVEKIELARDMPSARRKDYGFITFGTHDAAVTCAKNINNEELGEGENKAKVRARLSRPLQRGKGKHVSRGDFRPGRPTTSSFRSTWAPLAPRNLPPRGIRRTRGRLPPIVDRTTYKRPAGLRDRRPVVPLPPRGRARRPVAPLPRSYDRRPPVPSHTKNSLKREYSRREELPPRSSRAVADYGPPPRSATSERNSSYRDSYPTRGPAYADIPRGSSHTSSRRAAAYTDGGGYSTRFERPPPSYRETRPRDYDPPVPGSKRPYSALDDVPPRYADVEVRQSRARLDAVPPRYADSEVRQPRARMDDIPPRYSDAELRQPRARMDDVPPRYSDAEVRQPRSRMVRDDVPPRYADADVRESRGRLDYEMGGGSSQYGDTYSDRLGRSNVGGYGSSRSSLSGQDSHGLYSSRQGMSYGGGSYSGGDTGGMYSSSYGGDYVSRGSDVGGSSYSSSLYSGRSLGGSGYMGGSGGSGSYY